MTKALLNLDMTLPVGSVDAYIYRANQLPMLSLEEEQRLARSFYENNDLDAARHLVLAHLRFVVRIARGYLAYGLPHADLIQEGNIGLMKAVKRFDPNLGVRLVTFAVHWIKAEIHEYILRNWRIVKVATTKAQRKLFFNLRSMKKRLGWFTHEEVQEVAKDLKVSPADVMEMESRLSSVDASFDGAQDDDEESFTPAGYLVAPNSDPAHQLETKDWSTQYQDKLHEALAVLDARSQDILMQRWLSEEKVTLQTLSAKYKVSVERIRQLEQMAINKLKDALIVDG